MSELILERDERLLRRAQAHHITFSILLGNAGLTDAVIKEVDRELSAHGLVKVKVPGDDREERARIYAELADKLGAARIQAIGKTLVLYRPIPEEKEDEPVKPTKRFAAKSPITPRKTRARKVGHVTKKKALSN
ncbi:MAG: YhbY family RNA-binding protein [Sutterella sp.]|nr:YhbY family RNA-binding protein [Sutterella sp.]MDY3273841.1 YhbY family RNA-binding protein [Duodenibacillus sp.]